LSERDASKRLFDRTALRRQAVERLREQGAAPTPDPNLPAGTQRLIDELRIHQIELEMRNEELLAARSELEAALRRYTSLYDFAPVGYLTLQRNGSIVMLNLAAALELKTSRAAAAGLRFATFVAEAERTPFADFLESVFSGPSPQSCELTLDTGQGRAVVVQLEARSLPGGDSCLAVMLDISRRRQAEEQLRLLGLRDALTGLHNRAHFDDELLRLASGRQHPISIVMVDVNALKPTNDRDGHAAGDTLLKRTAEVLNAAFRAEDVAARIGGDEFAILLPQTDAAAASAAMQRLREVLQQHNANHPGNPVGLSIGIGTSEPGEPLSRVLARADADMYRDKRGASR
jgi:diguanylate cyclase (GGDEF)-like protein/PAS domain S-box-containing protein